MGYFKDFREHIAALDQAGCWSRSTSKSTKTQS